MFSSSQLLELFVALWEACAFCCIISKSRSALAHAQSKSGPVRADTLPAGPISVLLNVVQAILIPSIPLVYFFIVVCSGLEQPAWMKALALPGVIFGVTLEGPRKNALRVLICVVDASTWCITNSAFEHLGDQYHPIGRREKPRIVQTGPYAYVRHPLYALALLQPLTWSLMFWSYAPLFTMVATAVVFAVKIHIEEEAIQRDRVVREEYRAYMRKVPARLVPYVW